MIMLILFFCFINCSKRDYWVAKLLWYIPNLQELNLVFSKSILKCVASLKPVLLELLQQHSHLNKSVQADKEFNVMGTIYTYTKIAQTQIDCKHSQADTGTINRNKIWTHTNTSIKTTTRNTSLRDESRSNWLLDNSVRRNLKISHNLKILWLVDYKCA